MDNVFDIAKNFMKNPRYVHVEHYVIQELTKTLKPIEPYREEVDAWLKIENGSKIRCLMELVMDSINYCYWYGKHDVRPSGAGATTTRDIIKKIFYRKVSKMNFDFFDVNDLLTQFSIRRYPLLEERYKHLVEIATLGGVDFVSKLVDFDTESTEVAFKFFNKLITTFPGYGSDVFLKRASLFFIQLNRMFGWFKDFMNELPVPADYQLPRALYDIGCISYSPDLEVKIMNNELIPKNSLEECEIRAATILACKEIQKITGYSISDIDTWLWLMGRKIKAPFHLTITTDY